MHNSDQEALTIAAATLPELPVFFAVAEAASFRRAAQKLRVSPSAVSQAISRLERALGQPLFARTTRSVSLTEAGHRLWAEVKPSLELALSSLAQLRRARDDLSGQLRLNVPHLACHFVLPELLAAFSRRHPQLRVDIVVEDKTVDIIRGGFDAGIRLYENLDQDMVAVRISPAFRFVLAASPGYFSENGRPVRLDEVVEHRCLVWRYPTSGAAWRWEFQRAGREVALTVDGPISSSDADLLVACAKRGLGLCYVPAPQIAVELERGELESVLERHCLQLPGLFLYFPQASQKLPRLRAFLEVARQVSARAPSKRRS